ncbi:DUF4232 domain-containing protein [Amycolatopsis sp.]|uniref:DUF4232 domain-containing protein n=1 Tax=Amycolatopsis sp. TaxID=37632 RepID=UPI002C58E5C2|nr:DUF4232 domain-containing protein [Amycolatopsis sp.]HVV12610.1 DUF4232 domain-containing protein [Amycolatopsis sp.]
MAHTMITRLTVGFTALAGACTLGACGTSAPAASPAPAPVSSPAFVADSHSAPSTSTPRCGTADLSVSLGTPKESSEYPGQFDVPLVYRNISAHDCGLYGVPGVDLVGPDDPNGPVYHLTRVDNGAPYNEVTPGTTATATITVLSATPGSVGSNGSTRWIPARVETIPPGQTTALTAQWPSDVTVLRQDAATHPGSWVNGILADPA